MDEIVQRLRRCYLEDERVGGKARNVIANDSVDRLKNDVEDLFTNSRCNLASVEYANLHKMLALCYFKVGDEAKAICCLIESHAILLRQQIIHRYAKTEIRESVQNVPQTYGLKSSYVKFNTSDTNNIDTIKSKLSELPEEWYVVQITAQHESISVCTSTQLSSMCAVHIAILPTGRRKSEPLCVTLPKPKSHFSYDVCHEIQKLLSNNRSELKATYANNELYWKMRERQNNSMKAAIHELEYAWLREWRILFVSDPLDNHELVAELVEMIDKLISDCKVSRTISERSKWLLRKVALGACFLTREEIARAVLYVLPDHEKLAGNIILSIYGKLCEMDPLKNATRKTLVLIVDENIDYISFESMEVMKGHPVTRFPSLYVAYALFKEHESTMENGCKIIEAKDDMGTCIVNPSGDLMKMEKRMKIFIKYWLPHWKSLYNVKPKEEVFEDALVNHDILMYNGHGSGIQYLPGDQIEKLKVKSIVLLFGCNSIKLLTVGGRYPPYGVSNQFLIASSSCILGALWEVTDADIDKMTANFISSWIPSAPERPWSSVDINAWCSGTLKFLKSRQKDAQDIPMESEMLRAVARSKDVCSQYMTSAAIVMRGLPVKLIRRTKNGVEE